MISYRFPDESGVDWLGSAEGAEKDDPVRPT